MDDLDYRAKPVDQLAISIPIDFKCFRLVFKQLKDVIGRIASPKLIDKRVLVELYVYLLAVVCESFIEDRLKRYGRHFSNGVL